MASVVPSFGDHHFVGSRETRRLSSRQATPNGSLVPVQPPLPWSSSAPFHALDPDGVHESDCPVEFDGGGPGLSRPDECRDDRQVKQCHS